MRLLATVCLLFAAPFSNAERYIIVLDQEYFATSELNSPAQITEPSLHQAINTTLIQLDADAQLHASISQVYGAAIYGFSADFSAETATRLASQPGVKYVEPVRELNFHGTTQIEDNQRGHWGVDRIDQVALPFDRRYRWDYSGAGVRAYVLDTGILASHRGFEGRVEQGYNAIDGTTNTDDTWGGHGTNVAGVLGRLNYGVAQDVTLVPVKIRSAENPVTTSEQLVAAIDWVILNAHAPAVVVISSGLSSTSNAVDEAVRRLIEAGYPVVVSAGNNSEDACNFSPAREPSAITVGASHIADYMATFSNHGSCVDIFAPGENIYTATHLNDVATAELTGTSLSAGFVAGIVAMLLESDPSLTPDQIKSRLSEISVMGILREVEDFTINLLATSRLGELSGLTLAAGKPPIYVDIPNPLSGGHEIRWNSVEGATSYNVELIDSSGSADSYSLVGNQWSVPVDSLELGEQFVRVQACTGAVCTDFSREFETEVTLDSIGQLPAPDIAAPAPLVSSSLITWDELSWADRYELSVGFPDNTAMVLPNLTTTSLSMSRFSTEGLTPGMWNFAVKACAGQTCSPYSTRITSFVESDPGTAPAGLEVPHPFSVGDTVSWVSVERATSYNLELAGTSGTEIIYSGSFTQWTVRDELDPGVYYFRVQSCEDQICSEFSQWVATEYAEIYLDEPLAIPFFMTTPFPSPLVHGKVFSWFYVSDEAEYQLEQTSSNGTEIIASISGGNSWSIPNGMAPGDYSYRVRACYSDGRCSRYSLPGHSSVLRVETPQDLGVLFTSDTNLTATWDSVDIGDITTRDEPVYQLEQAGPDGAEIIYEGSQISTEVIGLGVGEYSYRVRACHLENNCSDFSPPVTVTIELDSPSDISEVATLVAGDSIAWSAVAGAGYYEFELAGANSAEIFNTGSSLSWIVPAGLAAGEYVYRVRACTDENFCSSFSAGIGAVIEFEVPQGLSVPSPLLGGNRITWNPLTDATFYQLEQVYAGASLVVYSGALLEWVVPLAIPGGRYSFRVRACNDDIFCSDYSEPVSTFVEVNAPTGLTAPNPLVAGSEIIWNPVTNAEVYELEQTFLGTSTIVQASASQGWLAPEGLVEGDYSYRVRACIEEDCSEYSEAVATSVEAVVTDPTATPENLSVPNPLRANADVITWDAVSAETTYLLTVRNSQGNFTIVYEGQATSWTTAGLPEGINDFRVRSCVERNCGPTSAIVSAEVVAAATVPPIPALSVPNPLSEGDLILWSGLDDGTIYELQLSTLIGLPETIYTGEQPSWAFDGAISGDISFRVRACSAAAIESPCSDYSAPVATTVAELPVDPKATPENLTVPNPLESTGGLITWDAVSDETTYLVTVNNSDGFFYIVYEGQDNRWETNGLPLGTNEFRVRSCVGRDCGPTSSIVSTEVVESQVPDPMATPTNLAVPNPLMAAGSVINWDPVSVETTYLLVVRNSEGNFRVIYEGQDTSWTTSGLPLGTNDFRVRSCVGQTCGQVSSIVSTEVVSP